MYKAIEILFIGPATLCGIYLISLGIVFSVMDAVNSMIIFRKNRKRHETNKVSREAEEREAMGNAASLSEVGRRKGE